MSDSLFSPSWYRVAGLQPRLRGHAQIHRHHYRGRLWYVLQDHASGRHHRFTPAAHYLIGLMDGRRRVQEIWELATERLGDEAPTQEEMIRLLGQLHAADLLLCDVPPDSLELLRRFDKQRRAQWKQRLISPLAVRLPLWDPERFLDRWLFLVRPLLGWTGFILWLAVVLSGAVLAALHWPELTDNLADRVLSLENLLILWLVYPLVKALHELGHGFAVKRWGGEVHEMGIMLLVLMPVPYVDASAASSFRDKHRRMVVGAAGMIVELFLAAVALVVWLNVEPGLMRAVAYNVMLIGGVSTLLFNGNPLLRFDGYYVLADAVEIPNLGTRSTRYLSYLIQRYLFGQQQASNPADTLGERVWFVCYGIAALIYRLFIMTVIILFVASQFFVIGILLALWASLSMVLIPLGKGLHFLLAGPALARRRVRAVVLSGAGLGSLAAFLTLVPLPLHTLAEGVIWLPERSWVRPGTPGEVQSLLAEPGMMVVEGQPLIRLADPFLSTQVRALEARLRELEARYQSRWREDRVGAAILSDEVAVARADLARARERLAALVVTSPVDGTFVVSQPEDLPGRFLEQGQPVAYVVGPDTLTARVVVSQADIGLVRERIQGVAIRTAGRIEQVREVAVLRQVPQASERLPSPALGLGGGGSIPVDPTDPEGNRVLESVFQLDLRLPGREMILNPGGRVYVRFDHGREPLAAQWYRRLRQLLLRRFDV